MGFFTKIIATVLNLIPRSMSAIRMFLSSLGNLFDKLGQDKAAAVTQQAEELAKWVEKNHQFTVEWFAKMYPDMQALLAVWSKLPYLMYVTHNVREGQQVNLHTAITAAQLAANELKNP